MKLGQRFKQALPIPSPTKDMLGANEYMKKCAPLLVHWGNTNKSTMKPTLDPPEWIKLKGLTKPSVGGE